MNKTIFLLVLFVAIFLSGCDPFKAEQIRAQSEADQSAAQSLQESLNAEQMRKQSAELHGIRMQDEQRKQARKDAAEKDVRQGLSLFINVTFFAGTAVAIYFVLLVGRSTTTQLVRLQEGFTTAMITAADMRARMIPLDPVTRQYPLLLQYVGKGRYTLTDPNKNVVIPLDTRNLGDAQMIAGSIAVQHSGLVAMEARKSGARDAASIALVQDPPIVEATAFDVKTFDKMKVASDLIGETDDEQ